MNTIVAPAIVIVTRPASAGQRLFDRIVKQGHHAVWWPAFDIQPVADSAAARAALSRLADYDLAIFVSANAVRAARPLLNATWPASTVIGAVGASTRAAIATELNPTASTTMIAPDDENESGSEAFWAAWQGTSRHARRVLLLRAEDGRNWLAERFVESGAEVDAVAAYSRRPHRFSADDLAQLQKWVAAGVPPAIVFSSSEAVAALDQQVGSTGRTWLRAGTAIASHVRIAEQLSADGYPRVVRATFDDDSIIAKLESMRSKR